MLEQLQESRSLWEHLKETQKPVVLYGMGDGALKIMSVLEYYGITLSGIFASDEFVRGHSFSGFPVRTLAQTRAEFGDFIILLAFGVFRTPLLDKIYALSEEFELYAPDVPVILDGPPRDWCHSNAPLFTPDYIIRNESAFDNVYQWLADELSRKTFRHVLNFKISGKIHYLRSCTSPMEEVYRHLIQPGQNEHYVDLGAYTGDTIQEFLSYTDGIYSHITAVEPDPKNFKKLQQMVSQLDLGQIDLHQLGAFREEARLLFGQRAGRNSSLSEKGLETPVNSVDNLLNGIPASIIKFDVEGAESDALQGCRETIRTWRPKLMISAYHRSSDLFQLPEEVWNIRQDYQLYLRHHPYVPAWETNYYLI